jgi:hypothetical protein
MLMDLIFDKNLRRRIRNPVPISTKRCHAPLKLIKSLSRAPFYEAWDAFGVGFIGWILL